MMKFDYSQYPQQITPESTNIKWLGFNIEKEWALAVEFFPWKETSPPSIYVYNLNEHEMVLDGRATPKKIWQSLEKGYVNPDYDRLSTGTAFSYLVKGRCPYRKVEAEDG